MSYDNLFDNILYNEVFISFFFFGDQRISLTYYL